MSFLQEAAAGRFSKAQMQAHVLQSVDFAVHSRVAQGVAVLGLLAYSVFKFVRMRRKLGPALKSANDAYTKNVDAYSELDQPLWSTVDPDGMQGVDTVFGVQAEPVGGAGAASGSSAGSSTIFDMNTTVAMSQSNSHLVYGLKIIADTKRLRKGLKEGDGDDWRSLYKQALVKAAEDASKAFPGMSKDVAAETARVTDADRRRLQLSDVQDAVMEVHAAFYIANQGSAAAKATLDFIRANWSSHMKPAPPRYTPIDFSITPDSVGKAFPPPSESIRNAVRLAAQTTCDHARDAVWRAAREVEPRAAVIEASTETFGDAEAVVEALITAFLTTPPGGPPASPIDGQPFAGLGDANIVIHVLAMLRLLNEVVASVTERRTRLPGGRQRVLTAHRQARVCDRVLALWAILKQTKPGDVGINHVVAVARYLWTMGALQLAKNLLHDYAPGPGPAPPIVDGVKRLGDVPMGMTGKVLGRMYIKNKLGAILGSAEEPIAFSEMADFCYTLSQAKIPLQQQVVGIAKSFNAMHPKRQVLDNDISVYPVKDPCLCHYEYCSETHPGRRCHKAWNLWGQFWYGTPSDRVFIFNADVDDERLVIILITGTNQRIPQFLNVNLKWDMVALDPDVYGSLPEGQPTAHVHDGFQRMHLALWTKIEPRLRELARGHPHGIKVIIAGHSLGAGLGVLTALAAANLTATAADGTNPVVKSVKMGTVACPYTLDKAGARLFQSRVSVFYNFVSVADPVPTANPTGEGMHAFPPILVASDVSQLEHDRPHPKPRTVFEALYALYHDHSRVRYHELVRDSNNLFFRSVPRFIEDGGQRRV